MSFLFVKTCSCLFFMSYIFLLVLGQKIDPAELKCLVCRRLVELMEQAVETIDPNKKVDVGSYRIDHKGDLSHKRVEYRRSEVYLTELMETICEKMDDYVRARKKSNGQLVVFPLMTESGQMNPIMSDVDIIQDSDLNKSLKFYCESIIEENDEGIVKSFSEPNDNLDIKICSEVAKLCNQTLQEDYEFETHGEL